MEILIKRINENAKLPAYSGEAAPGIDLYVLGGITIEPGATVTVPTGIAMAMPVGYVGVVWNKDCMVIGESVKVTTAMIDSGYRNEIIVELINTGSEPRVLVDGELVAQVLVQKVNHAHLIEAEDLSA